MLTKAIHTALNFVYEQTQSLMDAIAWKDEKLSRSIIKVMPDVNKTLFSTVTVLEHSLNNDLFTIAFELLDKYHANPNVTTENSNHKLPIPLVRYVLERNGLEEAKLLVLFGAEINRKTFHTHPKKSLPDPVLNRPNTRIILEEYKAIYEREIKGEHSNSELSATWQRLSDRESNEQLKICYKQKADAYLKEEKIQVSRVSLSSSKTTKKSRPSTSKVFDSSVGNPYAKFSPPKDTLTQSLLSDQQNINAGGLTNAQDNINSVTSKP